MPRITEEGNDIQIVSTCSSYPFLLMAGEANSGVSIVPSHLNNIGVHIVGEVFPGDAEWEVLQEKVEVPR